MLLDFESHTTLISWSPYYYRLQNLIPPTQKKNPIFLTPQSNKLEA